MGIKIDTFTNGVLVESIDTRTTEDINKEIDRERVSGYGSVQDQLDMIYWDQVNGTTLWKDKIANVKATHPKLI